MTVEQKVCVDVSLAVKWVVPEPDSPAADALLADWQQRELRMIAPRLFSAEVDSVIRKKVAVRGELTEEEGETAFAAVCRLPVSLVWHPAQRERAWQLAKEPDRTTVYDTTYLATAELFGCEFWTADEKLYNAVKDRLSYVRCIAELTPTSD